MCSNILCNDSRVIGLSRISRNTPVFPASTCVSAVTATTGMLLQSSGLPPEFYERYRKRLVLIPMEGKFHRSLNLANAASIVLYEALRQRRCRAAAN